MPKVQAIQAQPIWKGRATLGEGSLWSPSRNRLFFVDILGKRVISSAIDGSEVQQWAMPRRVCWLVECAGSEDFLVGLEDSIVFVNFTPGEPAEILRNLDWRCRPRPASMTPRPMRPAASIAAPWTTRRASPSARSSP
jgi:sugar lactone lactonase YvrE